MDFFVYLLTENFEHHLLHAIVGYDEVNLAHLQQLREGGLSVNDCAKAEQLVGRAIREQFQAVG